MKHGEAADRLWVHHKRRDIENGIRVLKYFLMTARLGSMTKAAQSLHITQPTLSRQIAELEEETGVHLLKGETAGSF